MIEVLAFRARLSSPHPALKCITKGEGTASIGIYGMCTFGGLARKLLFHDLMLGARNARLSKGTGPDQVH